ncbi:MAG: glycosyltransferase family 1 protein [Tenuifilaceae bacterium]|jgi:glycosyltransferase involved in cell wall biosynthesis|nr:glycosyltransferase family 1 protein [Tenuifilaceae bacterium]
MQIAVNTRLLIKDKLEGIGWFTFETIRRIAAKHPEHQFYFLFDRDPHPDFVFSANITPVVLWPQARHPFLWFLWFEVSVARFLKKHRIDLFVSPDGYIPLRSNVPSISVIHDINFKHHPEGIPYLTRRYYNHFFPRFASKANHIVTVSSYSKNDIAQSFKITPEKISVAHNGANEQYTPVSDTEVQSLRNELTSGAPYFVFVGALSPRKNVARLITAFGQFLAMSQKDYKLVIVGEPMFMTNDIKEALKSMANPSSIVFTGRLQVEKLRLVLGSAIALVYVPYFEGFGIPLVEAMRCHLPIIASNKTSIPEVVGDAALLVDPFDTNAIANAMKLVAIDSKLREALAERSARRKNDFSWDKTADALYTAMQKVLSEKIMRNA